MTLIPNNHWGEPLRLPLIIILHDTYMQLKELTKGLDILHNTFFDILLFW